MKKYQHDLLLRACASKEATEEEKNELSYAASMAAAGEMRLTQQILKKAETILGRARMRAYLWGAP